MLDRLNQQIKLHDYVWYNTKTRSSYLNIGQIIAINIKSRPRSVWNQEAHRYVMARTSDVRITVQYPGHSPSNLIEVAYHDADQDPLILIQSNRLLLATHAQWDLEFARVYGTATRN